jgi:hypothetical protein
VSSAPENKTSDSSGHDNETAERERLSSEIRATLAKPLAKQEQLSDSDLETELLDVEKTRQAAERLRETDPALVSTTTDWADRIRRAATAEKVCRTSTECLADRAAKPLCEALSEKKGHQADLAKEKANPAGVVNLAYLHDIGQALQDDDDRIAEAKRAYSAATKLPFRESRCAKKKAEETDSVSRLRACCGQLDYRASKEPAAKAAQTKAAAQQCRGLANSVPVGKPAPETGAVSAMLGGKAPADCDGF